MTTPDDSRSIDLSIEVPGPPEQVWGAIATGPGISSWFMPFKVAGKEGGPIYLDFGGGAKEEGTITGWEPPRRFAYEGTETRGRTLAFEWLVEAKDGGTCVVRLVNSGFGLDAEWDGDFEGMSGGWRIFLENLRLHLTHFAGRTARPIIPMGTARGPNRAAWEALCVALGISSSTAAGTRLETADQGAPRLAGVIGGVVELPTTRAYVLLLDAPLAGTGFIAAEGDGDYVGLSVWLYLYGDGAAEQAEQWKAWMAQRFPAPDPAQLSAPS